MCSGFVFLVGDHRSDISFLVHSIRTCLMTNSINLKYYEAVLFMIIR